MKNKRELKKIADYYDDRAIKSDGVKAAGQWGDKQFIPEITEEINKKIELNSQDRVLEIGCGSGVLGDWINKNCEFYLGLDISFQMLKKFQIEHSLKNSPNLVQGLTDRVPCRSDFFDLVVMNGVTMYFKNNEEFRNTLEEIERVATKKATIFIGENIILSGFYWELVWFQNLPKIAKIFAKPYVRFRRYLAKKNPKLEGKWKSIHHEISPDLLREFFKGKATIEQTDAAAQTTRKRRLGKRYRGNRRVDFVIKLQ